MSILLALVAQLYQAVKLSSIFLIMSFTTQVSGLEPLARKEVLAEADEERSGGGKVFFVNYSSRLSSFSNSFITRFLPWAATGAIKSQILTIIYISVRIGLFDCDQQFKIWLSVTSRTTVKHLRDHVLHKRDGGILHAIGGFTAPCNKDLTEGLFHQVSGHASHHLLLDSLNGRFHFNLDHLLQLLPTYPYD